MDIFAEHAVGGIIGLVFNALFGANYIIGLDGVNTGLYAGGWLSHNYKQLYIQVAYICAVVGYSFTMSAILAFLINIIPGLHLRASDEAELLGMDDDQIGEFAYDYVEVRRDYLAWTPSRNKVGEADAGVPDSDRYGIAEHGDMVEGRDPNSEKGSKHSGNEHTGIGGDRHAGGRYGNEHKGNHMGNGVDGGSAHTGVQGDRHAGGS